MMRTTLDLPEDIHTLARELAHQQKRTMSEVVTELIRNGLNDSNDVEVNESQWPTVTIGRSVTAEDVRTLEDE